MTLPNLITLFRLLLVPLTIWLMLTGAFAAAFWVFCAAGVSDGVDGFIARHFNLRTQLGAFLDPIADKALLVSVFVILGVIGALPAWLVILVVARDVMILGGFILLHLLGEAPEVRPLVVSKLNTAAQIALAACMLVRLGFAVALGPLQPTLIYGVALTTAVSGAAYLVQWSRLVGGKGTTP